MTNRTIPVNIPKKISPFLDAAFTFVALQSTCNSKYSSGFDKFSLQKRFKKSISENLDSSFKASEDELKLIFNLTNSIMKNGQFTTPSERKDIKLEDFSDYINNQVKHFKMLFINSNF
jgi:hypothetical protein